MKLAFNEATALEKATLELDLEACEKNGYDYIEIRFDTIRDYLKRHTLQDLADWFKTHKLKPFSYNTLIFFNYRDESGQKEIDDEMDFIIEVGNAIGLKTIITVPSFDVGPYTIDEIKEESVTKLCRLADKASKHGMRIALEFCGCHNCSINTFGTAYDVVTACNRENIGIVLDTFHFHAMGSKWEDLEKADGKKIFVWHINDSENLPIGSLSDDKRLWPGEGCIDLDRITRTLKQIGYDDMVSIEEFRPEYYSLEVDEAARIGKEKTIAVVSKHFSFD